MWNKNNTTRNEISDHFLHPRSCPQVAKGRFRLPTSTRYALCITLPLSSSSHDSEGGAASGVPRLHSLKKNGANEYAPKKSWPLKNLQALEGAARAGSDDEDFVLTFGGTQFVWCAYQRDQLNEFFFLLTEICKQHFRTQPQVARVATDELQALGELWADRHRVIERTPGNKSNPHVRALSALFRHRETADVGEKEVLEDRLEVRFSWRSRIFCAT